MEPFSFKENVQKMIEFGTNGKNLREMFNPLIAILEECRFKVSPNGIESKAVDCTHIGMIHLNLPNHIL